MVRVRLSLAFCLLVGFTAAGTGTSSSNSWQLVWSDEFDGPAMSSPDPAKWNYDAGGGGWGNNEEEVYCAEASDAVPCSAAHPNSYLDGAGHLIIKAISANGTWTSARLQTQDKESVQYGRVEARMKLPQGAGVWPAFWLLGNNLHTAGWPECGEIDVMENVPMLGARTIASTLHGPKSKGEGVGGRFTLDGGQQVDTGFHTYGVIWTPERVEFYVDHPEKPFFSTTKTALAGDWVYDHPFFLLLNLAIGGNWPGHSDETTPRPAVMTVDYVRVYKLATPGIK
jgi:beta-glucanase (GH16 family)